MNETRRREDDLIRRRDRSPTREENTLRHSHRQQRFQEEPPPHVRDHGGGHGRTLQQQQHSPSTTTRPALITTDEGPMNREANFSFLRSQSSPQRFGVTDLGRVSSKYIECTLTPHFSHTPFTLTYAYTLQRHIERNCDRLYLILRRPSFSQRRHWMARLPYGS